MIILILHFILIKSTVETYNDDWGYTIKQTEQEEQTAEDNELFKYLFSNKELDINAYEYQPMYSDLI